MTQFFSRPNQFFPRTFAILALIILVILPDGGRLDLYIVAALGALFPWFLHALDVLFGFGRGHGGSNPGDTGGFMFGDGGGGGDSGGGGE